MSDARVLHAFHGGAFFEEIGEDFASLGNLSRVVNADVLDAWYDPSPRVLDKISSYLPWLIKTSPPTHGDGLLSVISEVRGIPRENVLIGSGTSSLMYLAFPHLVRTGSKVVLLDPMYGEYRHIFEQVLGCNVVRHELDPGLGFAPQLDELASQAQDAELVVMVNPNSPTGVHVESSFIKELLGKLGPKTRLWVDETYVDFVPECPTVEPLVAADGRLIVAKSMSKFYGLSGLRVGYLVAPEWLVSELDAQSPPWSVGLLSQVAAVEALRDPEYYSTCRNETIDLRQQMNQSLNALPGLHVQPSVTNFLLLELLEPVAERLVEFARGEGVFLRNCDSLSNRFEGKFIRTAVKSHQDNRRILKTISGALQEIQGQG